jgi:hypothetical protein
MDMVEDLMQEILISAWQNLPNFRGEAGLRPWILGIARHKVEDYLCPGLCKRSSSKTRAQHKKWGT